jgi:hypothetical protein
MTEPILTADLVEKVYAACLYSDEETAGWDGTAETLPEGTIITDGILNQTGFHPGRIEENREVIWDMLAELPLNFRPTIEGGGGGWSFLNACMREDGEQWTGLHQTQDRLFQLGMAIGAVKYALPRAMWAALPGGMPYLTVSLAPVSEVADV